MTGDKEQAAALDRKEEERWHAVSSLAPDERNKAALLVALGDPSWRVRKAAVERIVQSVHPDAYLDGLIEGLHSEDNAGRRNSCLEALIRIGRPSVKPLLREGGSRDADVRKFVADILGEIGGAEAERGLRLLLRDADENISFAAAEALGKMKTPSAQAILRKEWTRFQMRPLVRVAVLESLANLGALLPVKELRKYAKDPILARPAVRLLGLHRTSEALHLVFDALEPSNISMRDSGVMALANMWDALPGLFRDWKRPLPGDVFVSLGLWLRGEESDLRFAAAKVVGALGLREYARSVTEIVGSETGAVIAERVFRSLGREAVRGLVLDFHARSPEKRAFCLGLFGEHGVTESLGLIWEALEDSDSLVRGAAAGSLATLGNRETIPRLLNDLEREEDPVVQGKLFEALNGLARRHRDDVLRGAEARLKAAPVGVLPVLVRLLGVCGRKRHLASLAVLLRNESPAVRREALAAMAALKDPRLLQHATAFLHDDEAENRLLGCKVISGRRGREAFNLLRRMIHDKNGWVRLEAVRGIVLVLPTSSSEVTEVLSTAVLDPMGPVAIFAFEELTRLNLKEAMKHLGAVLAHSEPRVQFEVVKILERNGLDPVRADIRARVPGLREEARIEWLQWAMRSRRKPPRDFVRELARQEKNIDAQRLLARWRWDTES